MLQLEKLVRSHSTAIIRGFIVAGCLAALAATGLHIDNSVEHLMIADDPVRLLDERAKAEFGNDEVLLIAFDLGAPFTVTDIEKLASISERVASFDSVKKVVDLATTEDVRSMDGGLDASRLVSLDTLREDFERIRQRAVDHRLYDRLLISKNQDVFGMLVTAEDSHSNSKLLNEFTRAVVAVVEETARPWGAYYAGYPITAFEANRIVKRDLGILTPPVIVLIAVILYAFTRRLFPFVLMAALVGWTQVVALAWLALTDTPLNVVVSSVPTILLATASTYLIYALGLLGRLGNDPEPGVALVRLLGRPVLLSSISTAVGFLSLRLIHVRAIGDFGAALSVGIVAAAFGTLLLLPALIQRYRWVLIEQHIPWVDRLSQWGVVLAKRPGRAIALTAIAVAIAVPGVFRLRVHTDTIHYFADDNVVRRGAEFFAENLTSGFLLNVVVRAEEPGGALDPSVIDLTDAVAGQLERSEHVDRTVSMLDYFYLMDAALRPGETPRTNPGSRDAAAQYMLLYESSGDPDDYSRYVNFDRSALAMLVSVHGGSRAYLDLADEIQAIGARAPDGVSVETLGSTFLYSRAMDGLTRGMVKGVAAAAFFIGAMMLLGLRSVSLGVVAAIPNLVPILLCGGVLGWLDVPLSMGTSLVGCISLGLAVDDTAHVLGHLDRSRSLESVYRMVGPALVMTTLALVVGFSALMLSEFQSVVALGAATAATMGVALLCDLWLLPSLLALLGYRVRGADENLAHGDGPATEAESTGQVAAA